MMLTFFSSLATMSIIMIIVWVVVAILAVIIETETAALVSIWFAVGALGGLICAAFDLPIYIQAMAFVALTGVSLALTRPLVKRLTNNTELKTNADRVIGEVAEVTQDIPAYGRGEVFVLSQKWAAVSLDHQTFNLGQNVVVKNIDGNKLIVDSVKEIDIK